MKHKLCGIPSWQHSIYLRTLAQECMASDFEYGTDLYFAASAIEEHGNAVRDNSFEELVAIGKMERTQI